MISEQRMEVTHELGFDSRMRAAVKCIHAALVALDITISLDMREDLDLLLGSKKCTEAPPKTRNLAAVASRSIPDHRAITSSAPRTDRSQSPGMHESLFEGQSPQINDPSASDAGDYAIEREEQGSNDQYDADLVYAKELQGRRPHGDAASAKGRYKQDVHWQLDPVLREESQKKGGKRKVQIEAQGSNKRNR
jgi:hypothetical protein